MAFEPPPVPIHVVRPQSLLVPSRVRVFVDFVVPRLREGLAAVAVLRRPRVRS